VVQEKAPSLKKPGERDSRLKKANEANNIFFTRDIRE
jgi:hypothetical protein